MSTLLELAARNAIAAALLAAVVLIASRFDKRPAVRNALWMIVLVRLLLPPIWSVPLPRMVSNAESEKVTPEIIAAPVEELPSVSSGELLPIDIEMAEFNGMGMSGVPQPTPATSDIPLSLVQEQAAVVPTDRVPPSGSLPPVFFSALLFLWLAGTVGILAIAIVRIRRFQRSLRDSLRAPKEVQTQAEQIAARLGLKHCPTIWLVPGRVPPMLWMPGLSAKRAKLIFPMVLFFHLDGRQRGALIAHELAHLRRRDPWVRWLEVLTVALYWWYPLLGFIRRRLRASEEECCDAWVVSQFPERKAYATALVETVDFLNGPDRLACPELASGASPVHDLQRRLTMIMRGSKGGRLTRFGAAGVLGIAMTAFAFGPAFSSAQDRPAKERVVDNNRPRDEPGERAPDPFRPKDNEPKRDAPNPDEVKKAYEELDRARTDAEKAMKRVHEAEERMMKLIGNHPGPFPGTGARSGGPRPLGVPGTAPAPRFEPGPPVGFGPGEGTPPPGRAAPGLPGSPGSALGIPRRDSGAGGPGGMMGGRDGFGDPNQIQEMQKQINEMRRMLEEIRQQLRPGAEGPKAPPRGDRKDFFRPDGNTPSVPSDRRPRERTRDKNALPPTPAPAATSDPLAPISTPPAPALTPSPSPAPGLPPQP